MQHGGFHGRLAGIETTQCSACHTEHKGRGADIVKLESAAFPHSRTDFPLQGAHANVACGDCHPTGRKFRDAPVGLLRLPQGGRTTRRQARPRLRQLSRGHRLGPRPLRPREDLVALAGKHAETACDACHLGNRYDGTPTQCASCHTPDDVHAGSRGTGCADCHHGLGLDGHEVRPPACHGLCARRRPRADRLQGLPQDGQPEGPAAAGLRRLPPQRRAACDALRQSLRPVPRFDRRGSRQRSTTPAMASSNCAARTRSSTAMPATPQSSRSRSWARSASGCHRAHDVHGGQLGRDCAQCHGVETWRGRLQFDHDFTAFPLVGLHVAVPCFACHRSAAYKGTPQDCVDCHAADDRHKGSLGRDCGSCHSASGWNLWEFDHGKATRFALTGAHANVACAGCHKQPPHVVKPAPGLRVLPWSRRRAPRAVRPAMPAVPCDHDVQGRSRCSEEQSMNRNFFHQRAPCLAAADRGWQCPGAGHRRQLRPRHDGIRARRARTGCRPARAVTSTPSSRARRAPAPHAMRQARASAQLPKPADHVRSTENCAAATPRPPGFRRRRFDHQEARGDCASCHNGVPGAGQAHRPRGDDAGVLRVPRQRGMDPGALRPRGHHRQLRLVPRRRQGDGQGAGRTSRPRTPASPAMPSPAGRRSRRWTTRRSAAPARPAMTAASATGKHALHVPTTAAATPATRPSPGGRRRSRTPASTGDCAACHDGARATGPGPRHIKATNGCAACHATTAWRPVVAVDHANVLGSCSTCHDGLAARGQPANHVPTTAGCENCHATTAWTPAKFDHTGVATNCVSCHDGTRAVGKNPRTSAPRTPASRATWLRRGSPRRARRPRAGDRHLLLVSRRHEGRPARTPTHIPSDNTCDRCHTTVPVEAGQFLPRRRHRALRHLPRRHRATGKSATHISVDPAVRCLPRDVLLAAREQGRPCAGQRHLRLLPQRRQREGQGRRPPVDDGRVRRVSCGHGVEAGDQGRPCAGDRHVRVLPRRHQGHRQGRCTRSDDGRLLFVPRHGCLEALDVHARRHRQRLRELPQRHERHGQDGRAHRLVGELRVLPCHGRLEAGHARRPHAGAGHVLPAATTARRRRARPPTTSCPATTASRAMSRRPGSPPTSRTRA